jgi:excisionase family DNA binding protein
MQKMRPHNELLTLLTVREVADKLRLDVSTVYRWINTGMIGAVQFGGRSHSVRIPAREIVRLAASSEQPASESAPDGVLASSRSSGLEEER